MSKTKPRKRKKDKKPKPQPQKTKENLLRPAKQMLEVVLIVLAIVGFGITVLTVFPRISVSNLEAIDVLDPFSTPFLISNDGYLPLYNVEFLVAIRRLERIGGGGITGTDDFQSKFTTPDFSAPIFRPTEKFSLYAGRIVKAHNSVSFADIAIVIEFRPMLWPFRRSSQFRFVTQKGADGKLYWMARPVGE